MANKNTMNITEYTETVGKMTVDEEEFNSVDSLILSQLSYLKFEGIVPEMDDDNFITINEISKWENVDNLFRDERYRTINTGLFNAAANSNRFKNVKLKKFIDIVDSDFQIQFSAVVFEFENGLTYVAFRGTDDNLVGWQEDLNMIYQTPVPAQEKALWYLNTVSKEITGDFYVGGHSKGGNLAVYSSMMAEPCIQDRIINIFSHDGPGFKKETLNKSNFDRVKSKIIKQVPKSSVFGLMLTTGEKIDVVLCHKISGISQHNPFNWIVEGTSFKQADKVDRAHIIQREAFNNWAEKLTDTQARTLSEQLFMLFDKAGLNNINDFQGDIATIYNNYKTFTGAAHMLDDEIKDQLDEIIQLYKDTFAETAKEETLDDLNNVAKNMNVAKENALENMQMVMDNVKSEVKKSTKGKRTKTAVITIKR